MAPVALVFCLCEVFLRFIPTSYRIKNAQLAADAPNIQLLILGNSHASYGLDPRRFSIEAFNAASVNQSLYFDKRIVLKYLGDLKNLKYVLISLDFHSLYFSDEGMRNIWSYYGYGINYKNSLPLITRYSYLYGYKGQLALEFLKRPFEKKYAAIRSVDVDYDLDLSHSYEKGYVGKIGGPYLSEQDDSIRATFFNDIVRTSVERNNIIADLDGLIDTLKKRHIIPILITLPNFRPFTEFLDKKVIKQNKTDILTLTGKWNIPYWDYFTMPLDSNCFYNGDHLSEKGAAIVTTEVNRRLISLASDN
jgi:hypothetical protein